MTSTLNVLEIEKKLLKEKLELKRSKKIKKYIEQLNKRLESFSSPTGENLKSKLIYAEKLSSDFKMPLKVKGVFLIEGRPQKKFYPAEELEKAAKNPKNQKFRIMQDHRENETAVIIGMVDKIEYDPNIKGIRWYGHINDETAARNIYDGIINEVSVTVYSVKDWSDKHGVVGRDLEFSELSTVIRGAVKGNKIEVW